MAEQGRKVLFNFSKIKSPEAIETKANTKTKARHILKRSVYTEIARQQRLDQLENYGSSMSEIRSMRLDPTELRGNIECLIGAVEIPLGAAGPLLLRGTNGEREAFAPIATTEGALLSSINRGCHALGMSGGVFSRALKQRMQRSPFFDCGNAEQSLILKNWILQRQNQIKLKARQFSSHAILLEVDCRLIPPCLHIRFVFETGDASGQNMTTLCTWNLCNWIISEFSKQYPKLIKHFLIDGNLSTDKKHSYISAIVGRGVEVIADALVPESVINRVLGSNSEDIARYFSQCQSSAVLTGTHGFNINVANVIAGIFTATGQDIACIHESSTAQLHFEKRPEGLYLSLLLPNLVIGTVGGGTGLPAQKQMLEFMNCQGAGQIQNFAECIAGFCLALELSTASALAGGQFALAHERLGRNRVEHWLKKSDLTASFFNHFLAPDEELGQVLEAYADEEYQCEGSLIMDLTSQISKRPCGLWPFVLRRSRSQKPQKIFLKSKVSDKELLLALEVMAGMSSPGLAELLKSSQKDNPFQQFHIREIEIAEMQVPALKKIMPKTLGTVNNSKLSTYIIAQEFLQGLELFGAVEKRDLWSDEYISTAIQNISGVHAHFLNRFENIASQPWILRMNLDRAQRLSEVYLELARNLHRVAFDWFSVDDLVFHESNLPFQIAMWSEIEAMPQTLVHNDFNPRNLAFRRNNSRLELVAYDWELASIHLPQRDLVELLAFCLEPEVNDQKILQWLSFHRKQLEAQSGEKLDEKLWLKGCRFAVYDLLLCRFPIYSIAESLRHMSFLKPSYKMAKRILHVLDQELNSLLKN